MTECTPLSGLLTTRSKNGDGTSLGDEVVAAHREWKRIFNAVREAQKRLKLLAPVETDGAGRLQTEYYRLHQQAACLRRDLLPNIDQILDLKYHRLSVGPLKRRTAAGLPELIPMRWDRATSVFRAVYLDALLLSSSGKSSHRESLEGPSFCFMPPAAWPIFLIELYADVSLGMFKELGRRLRERTDKAYLPEAVLEVSLEGLIPDESREALEEAAALVGAENVYVVVDARSANLSSRFRVPARQDPVGVIILPGEEIPERECIRIYHVNDFDLTPAEEMLALGS